MLATPVLLALILVAVATDLRCRRIYNWTTYPGILLALGSNLAGAAWLAWSKTADETLFRRLGWIGPVESLLGLAVCGLVMLACYVFFRIGGGDVKLVAMLGAFLGAEQGLEAMLWTFVLGACVGLIMLCWRAGPLGIARRVWQGVLCSLRLRSLAPLTDEERARLRQPMHLAPCALAAVVIVRFPVLGWLPW